MKKIQEQFGPSIHCINQPIKAIMFSDEHYCRVGEDGVTRIEACQKCGEMSYIPYIRVWKGDICFYECCQHGLQCIEFESYFIKEDNSTTDTQEIVTNLHK